jgi:peptidoglycan/LPS O-acetylase OafA/YrhL
MDVVHARTASVAVAAAIDVIAVLTFALIGRVSHDEGALGLFATAWPFLGGLAVGWVVMRAWRHPRRIVWAGVGVWVATVVGGMLLRMASGQGTQLAFVLVATAALGGLLIGWRALSLLVPRIRRQQSS